MGLGAAGRCSEDPQQLGVEGLDVALVLGLHQDAAQDPGFADVGGQGRVAAAEPVGGQAQGAQVHR
jgi:hypothetical protein